eukprot:1182124-Prorocentrum_minimum.AAC.1
MPSSLRQRVCTSRSVCGSSFLLFLAHRSARCSSARCSHCSRPICDKSHAARIPPHDTRIHRRGGGFTGAEANSPARRRIHRRGGEFTGAEANLNVMRQAVAKQGGYVPVRAPSPPAHNFPAPGHLPPPALPHFHLSALPASALFAPDRCAPPPLLASALPHLASAPPASSAVRLPLPPAAAPPPPPPPPPAAPPARRT